jgi:hypothetical protein
MQHYKAPNNSLHCIEPEFAYLLPVGCVPITAEEAEALRPKPPEIDPKDEIREQIRQLLSVAGVSQDWHLDAMMAGMVALAATQGISEPDLYSVNPGYKQVKDVSEQIKALRAQL